MPNTGDYSAQSSLWDKRAWATGGLGGLLAAALFLIALAVDPDGTRWDYSTLVGLVGFSAMLVILPPILAGISRRRWFLWAYLPLAIFLVCGFSLFALFPNLDSGAGEPAPLDRFDRSVIAVCFAAPFVSSLPVVLFRLYAARKHRQKILSAIAASEMAQAEGVWPPRPIGSD